MSRNYTSQKDDMSVIRDDLMVMVNQNGSSSCEYRSYVHTRKLLENLTVQIFFLVNPYWKILFVLKESVFQWLLS